MGSLKETLENTAPERTKTVSNMISKKPVMENPERKKVLLYLDPEEWEKFKAICKKNDVSASSTYRKLIRDFIRREESGLNF